MIQLNLKGSERTPVSKTKNKNTFLQMTVEDEVDTDSM